MVAKKKSIRKKTTISKEPKLVVEPTESVTVKPKHVEAVEAEKPDVLTPEVAHLCDCILKRFFREDTKTFNKQLYHIIGQRFGYHIPEMKRRERLWK